MTSPEQQLHAKVYGRVQGVSFRYYTVLRAQELGVTGWVSNLDDGSVEVRAEGTNDQLNALLQFLQVGPSGAHVTKVEREWNEVTHIFHGFNVR